MATMREGYLVGEADLLVEYFPCRRVVGSYCCFKNKNFECMVSDYGFLAKAPW